MKTHALARLLIFCLTLLPATAETDWIELDGKLVHPTRILAARNPESGALSASSTAQSLARSWGMEVSRPFKHTPELMLFEIPTGPVGGNPAAKAFREPLSPGELKERIQALRDTGEYEFVEPDYRLSLDLLPNDQGVSNGELWGLHNTGQFNGVAGVDVDAAAAWDITTGSSDVIVAVIDTGVRYTHQDLATQMWINPGESGNGRENNGRDDDNDGYVDNVYGINAINGSGDPWDDNDHGTHCAGTIGAAANNGSPHVGVAWDVSIMALKFLDAGGSGSSSDAIACVDFAVSKGARILSNSWGGGGASNAMRRAIDRAAEAGVLFIAAAGNDGSNNDRYPQYPAGYESPNVISVAAIDRRGELARFSNYGIASVDIGAPGVSIYSTTSSSDRSYDTFSGTSMATPHVAGVAALIASRYPSISMAELRDRLVLGSVPLASLAGRTVSGGRVSADRALTVSADGVLELSIGTATPPPLRGGTEAIFTVRVSDLAVVRNATVTATTDFGTNLDFRDDGRAADEQAQDGVYSAAALLPGDRDQISLTVSARAPGKTDASETAQFNLSVPPPNDNFADRNTLASGEVATVSSESATKENLEPNHAGNRGRKSGWWQWAAPSGGRVSVTTNGSDFDTTLGVYVGNDIGLLAEIGSDDDSGDAYASSLEFFAIAGQEYAIAVDGFGGAGGNIQINLNHAGGNLPGNDLLEGSTPINSTNYSFATNNESATRQPGEPAHAGNPGGASLWWQWTPAQSGTVTIDTEDSSIDTILGVYRGVSISSLNTVASDDDGGTGFSSRVQFSAIAGERYWIAVDGYNGATGDIQLSLNQTVSEPNDPTPPANGFNDNLSAARLLSASAPSFTTQGTNTEATKETGEPWHAGNRGGKSVWWRWTAPQTAIVTITTEGSNFDTLLAVYTTFGSGMNGLMPLASNDDTRGLTSEVSFFAFAGTDYFIAVDGYAAAAGDIQLSLNSSGSQSPSFDVFSSRGRLESTSGRVEATNEGAGREPGEPWHLGFNQGASMWWTWTADQNGIVEIDTRGSDFDTVLAVYTGGSLVTLQEVASNDDAPGFSAGLTSLVRFSARAGTSYHIAVDGYGGATGNISLGLNFIAQQAQQLSRLSNFSIRAATASARQPLILGFSTNGEHPMSLLARAVGPGLKSFGVTHAAIDPSLQLFRQSGHETNLLMQNDDWTDAGALAATFAEVGAFPLDRSSRDAALRYDEARGTHSLVVSNQSSSGVVLAEVYQIPNPAGTAEFSNISVRNHVGSVDDVLILGFVLEGATERRILIRGIGPTLQSYGVSDVLQNPRLRILRSNGEQVAQNDGWKNESGLAEISARVGAFALDPGTRDAATEVTLSPGAYSVIVDGLNGSTGTALVELYLLP